MLPSEAKTEPTELEMLENSLAASYGKMREVLRAMESRLDVALGPPPPQPVANAAAVQPLQPGGAVASLSHLSRDIARFCDDFDTQLRRLQRLT